jgi:beta-lactamase regulating signal transducer with metallopeptidase domain
MWDSLESTLLGEIATAGTSVLMSSAIQATALLALVGLIAWSMRAASAAVRHLLWFGAMIGLATLPVLTVLLPGWEVLPRWEIARATSDTGVAAPAIDLEPTYAPAVKPDTSDSISAKLDTGRPASAKPDESNPIPVRPDASNSISATPETSTDDAVQPIFSRQVANAKATVEPGAEPATYGHAPAGGRMTWQVLILVVWVIGCIAALLPVAAGMASLGWLEWTSTRVGSGPLESAAQCAAGRLAVKRNVRLLVNERRAMPMMWGVLWPKVLVPVVAQTWSAERLEAVLMHELAHVRRLDCLTQFVSRAVCALYWYHPLAWWAARRMRMEAEAACDNLVLLAGCRPADYAEHLLKIAAGSRIASPLGSAAIGMAWRSHLEIRLRAILDDGRNRLGPSYASTAGCAVLVAGLSCPLALLRSESPADRALPKTTAAENPFVYQDTRASAETTPLPIRLGYVDDTTEGARSIAGGGHAVLFRRPEGARFLMAVEMFAHRYGHTTPPDEDFHVYILDKDRKLIEACSYPYAQIEWGFPRWHTLKLPAVEVPDEYYVVTVFNPHQTKGIYLAFDTSMSQSHSSITSLATGFQPVPEGFDWMIRSVLVREIPKSNPFETDDSP